MPLNHYALAPPANPSGLSATRSRKYPLDEKGISAFLTECKDLIKIFVYKSVFFNRKFDRIDRIDVTLKNYQKNRRAPLKIFRH